MRRKSPAKPLWRRILGGTLYVLFLAIIFTTATAAGWVKQSPLLAEIIVQRLNPRPPEEVFKKESLTLLVLGCDQDLEHTYSRAYKERIKREFLRTGVRPHVSKGVARGKARADMIMVARLDFKTNRITGVSIPRDLELELPGYRARKITEYYAIAPEGQSEQLMKTAVEYVLPGVMIDRVVTLDFSAFENVVDMLGGVPIDVEKNMRYVDVGANLFINLEKGRQILDGYESMGFVRFRHSDSDFERQRRQKEFLVSLKQEMMRPGNLKSIPQVLEESKKVLGGALSDPEIAGMAGFAQRVSPENIKLGMVPTFEQPRPSTNLTLDQNNLFKVLHEHDLIPYYYQANRSSR